MADAEPAAGWGAVRLTEARQVLELMGSDPDGWPAADVDVRRHYRTFLDAGAPSAALSFLAHALPRLEAVAWAARVVADAARLDPPPPRQRHALDTALRWLDDPTDHHRRAARDAADAVGEPVAEQFLGKAVFYSGGSIAPPAAPPVMPPEHVVGRYVAAAIGQLANRGAEPDAALARALRLGEAMAERGLEALGR